MFFKSMYIFILPFVLASTLCLFNTGARGASAKTKKNDYKAWKDCGVVVYTTQQETSVLSIIDPVKMKVVGEIENVGKENHNVFTSYDGRYVYVSAGKDIVKIEIRKKYKAKVIKRNQIVPQEEMAHVHLAHIALTRDGKKLYIADGKDNVYVVDAETLETITAINIPVGLDDIVTTIRDSLDEMWEDEDSNPHGLALHPGGRYVYVPNVWSGSVSIIDTYSDEILKTLNLNTTDSAQQGHGTTPVALGFSTDGHYCFVSCAVPGYDCILNTSDPSNPTIENTVSVGLSPIQVPANPTNRYFIAPCQTSSLFDNKTTSENGVPDPVFNNTAWVSWANDAIDTTLDLTEALLNALHQAEPSETNDGLDDACFVVEIEDNYNHNGASWEIINSVVSGKGPHGISYAPGGNFAFVTHAQEIIKKESGMVAVVEETDDGKFEVTQEIPVGLFPNGIATKFGRNQNM